MLCKWSWIVPDEQSISCNIFLTNSMLVLWSQMDLHVILCGHWHAMHFVISHAMSFNIFFCHYVILIKNDTTCIIKSAILTFNSMITYSPVSACKYAPGRLIAATLHSLCAYIIEIITVDVWCDAASLFLISHQCIFYLWHSCSSSLPRRWVS